jgi:HTH-type transcriptional regulator, sugar sensing transcriptional regulator
MTLAESLAAIGFTGQEATLYLALLRSGDLTGYEAARAAGVAKSNAYLSLASLVVKGGALLVEEEPARYAAVPVSELIAGARRRVNEALSFLERNAPARSEPRSGFATVSERARVIEVMKDLIETAEKRLYVSMAPEDLAPIRAELEAARERGLKVVIISSPPFAMERVNVYLGRRRPGRVRLIADSIRVLTGEIAPDRGECVLSENARLVDLIKDSLTDEMKLIELEKVKGRQ